jgi:hypothetical protein
MDKPEFAVGEKGRRVVPSSMGKRQSPMRAALQHNEDTIARLEDQLRHADTRAVERTHALKIAQETLDLVLKERAAYHAALAMHERYLAVLEALVSHVR